METETEQPKILPKKTKRKPKGGKKKKWVRKPPIPRYRTKKGKKGEWPTYEEAKAMARARGIKSRQQYFDYHDIHKPLFLSRFPYNIYKKEWVTWSDFLGTTNVFNDPHQTRRILSTKTYWESVRHLQPLKIPSSYAYNRMVRNGELPGFSLYPNVQYKTEWTGWDNYLSKTVKIKLEMANMNKPLWVIVHIPGDPENVVWFLKVAGEETLKDQMKPGWRIVAKYMFEENLYNTVWEILENNSSFHFDKEQRLCNNINQLLWELSSVLLIVK